MPDAISQNSARGWRKHLLRKTLPLVLLATAAALVGVQLLAMIPHDVNVQIEITPTQSASLKILEIFVSGDSDQDEFQSAVQFRFDSQHRPAGRLEHTFSLTNGDYSLKFRLTMEDGAQVDSQRSIKVNGETFLVLPSL